MRTFLQGFKNLEDILSISIFKVTYLHISYLQGYLNASWHSHTPTALFYLNGITLGVPSVFCDQSHLPSRRTLSSGSRLGLSSEIPLLSWQLNPVLWPQHHRPCPVPWSFTWSCWCHPILQAEDRALLLFQLIFLWYPALEFWTD